jgi:hypothetical protein
VLLKKEEKEEKKQIRHSASTEGSVGVSWVVTCSARCEYSLKYALILSFPCSMAKVRGVLPSCFITHTTQQKDDSLFNIKKKLL